MNYSDITIFIFIGISSVSYAKCRSWENGAPSFCAEMKVKYLVRTEERKCFFNAEVKSYIPSTPKLKQNDEFEKNIKSKEEHLVESSEDFCKNLLPEKEIKGLIVGKCHDNIGDAFFGLEHFFRKLFNSERLYPSFKLTKEAKLTHFDSGSSTENIVSCPDFFK